MNCPLCNTKLELKTLSIQNDSEKMGLFCKKHQSFFGIVDRWKTRQSLGIDTYQIVLNEKEIFEEKCFEKINECFK